MRAVVQRVREASVTVAGEVVGTCDRGVVVLLGVASVDTPETAEMRARRIARLRIFENDEGRLDRSLVNVGGDALVVSQFTFADTTKGNRPSFTDAARPEYAEPLFEAFCEALEREGAKLARGVFGARMEVALVNDGPVTVVLEPDHARLGVRTRPRPRELRCYPEPTTFHRFH